MNDKVLVIGYGPVGAATVALLAARGQTGQRGAKEPPGGFARHGSFRRSAT